MKVTAFSAERVTKDNKNGKCVLDLTKAKDIKTFGGQEAVDEYTRNVKINAEMGRLAEQSLIDQGVIEGKEK